MKILFTISIAILLFTACSSDAIFQFDGSQSMLITGKGPGQDGAINPYYGQASIAKVRNLGDNILQVRVQEGKTLIENMVVSPGEKKSMELKGSYQMYVETDVATKAKIRFMEAD